MNDYENLRERGIALVGQGNQARTIAERMARECFTPCLGVDIQRNELIDYQVYNMATITMMKSIQCGKTVFENLGEAFLFVAEKDMLKTINKKRTPGYVLESLKGIKK